MSMVIYKTTNRINGHYYIGKDARNRNFYLGSGRLLKNALKKYGRENFHKEILEYVDGTDLSKLLDREIHWIDKLDAVNDPMCYNIQRNSGLYIYTPTEDVRRKISDGIKRAWKTNVEYRNKVFRNNRENNPMAGKTQSDYQRKRARDTNTGKVVSESTRNKIRCMAIGRKASEETKAKMRASQRIRQLREKEVRQCQSIK